MNHLSNINYLLINYLMRFPLKNFWSWYLVGIKFLLFSFFKFLFIYLFWLCWFFVAAWELSLGAASRSYSLLQCMGFSCCRTWAPGIQGFSSCSSWAPECRLSSCCIRALVALWHEESSWTRDRTCVPCIARHILNLWTTREVHIVIIQKNNLQHQQHWEMCPTSHSLRSWYVS